jgi:hypothetical protein
VHLSESSVFSVYSHIIANNKIGAGYTAVTQSLIENAIISCAILLQISLIVYLILETMSFKHVSIIALSEKM